MAELLVLGEDGPETGSSRWLRGHPIEVRTHTKRSKLEKPPKFLFIRFRGVASERLERFMRGKTQHDAELRRVPWERATPLALGTGVELHRVHRILLDNLPDALQAKLTDKGEIKVGNQADDDLPWSEFRQFFFNDVTGEVENGDL